ncbi:MAG: SUMF1/EgtB/PvdO family nonheme iron enzyme [Ignavibacteriaceae bacterium]|nr:SUMF1/EgtB/PvdO family nonheme iron enzyme [Ignavibacteriaceae bacterium]
MPLRKLLIITAILFPVNFQINLTAQTTNAPVMRLIEKGTYYMGCSYGDADPECRPESAPVRKVTLNAFEISESEVTQALWSEVMGYNNSEFKGANRPVENISWYEAVEFCNRLSALYGLTPAYKTDKSQNDPDYNIKSDKVPRYLVKCDFTASGYRLPTEAEWEFAARGGSAGKGYRYAGDNNPAKVAVYGDNSGRKTKPVKSLAPNEAGLYDMSGNVAEWCWDWYASYADMSGNNPLGAEGGTGRVYRGGSWINTREVLRNDARGSSILNYTSSTLGFRVVRSK